MQEQLQAFGNGIIFKFQDELLGGMFAQTTESGIYIPPSHQDTTQSTRISTVVAVGPRVKNVTVGDNVLIEPLKWTEHFVIDGQKFWKTDEDQVLAICE